MSDPNPVPRIPPRPTSRQSSKPKLANNLTSGEVEQVDTSKVLPVPTETSTLPGSQLLPNNDMDALDRTHSTLAKQGDNPDSPSQEAPELSSFSNPTGFDRESPDNQIEYENDLLETDETETDIVKEEKEKEKEEEVEEREEEPEEEGEGVKTKATNLYEVPANRSTSTLTSSHTKDTNNDKDESKKAKAEIVSNYDESIEPPKSPSQLIDANLTQSANMPIIPRRPQKRSSSLFNKNSLALESSTKSSQENLMLTLTKENVITDNSKDKKPDSNIVTSAQDAKDNEKQISDDAVLEPEFQSNDFVAPRTLIQLGPLKDSEQQNIARAVVDNVDNVDNVDDDDDDDDEEEEENEKPISTSITQTSFPSKIQEEIDSPVPKESELGEVDKNIEGDKKLDADSKLETLQEIEPKSRNIENEDEDKYEISKRSANRNDSQEKIDGDVGNHDFGKVDENLAEMSELLKSESKSREEQLQLNQKPIPVIPRRPAKKDLQLEKSQKNPPPPKPKKLSSRIAAFQEQLFSNPKASDSNSDEKQSAAPRVPHFQKFQGQGIPLPGLMRPQGGLPFGKPTARNEERETAKAREEEEDKEDEEGAGGGGEEEVKARAIKSVARRTVGPRGKKLPKSVTQTKIERLNPREPELGLLWKCKFVKQVESNTSAVKEERQKNDEQIHDDIIDPSLNKEVISSMDVPETSRENHDDLVEDPVNVEQQDEEKEEEKEEQEEQQQEQQKDDDDEEEEGQQREKTGTDDDVIENSITNTTDIHTEQDPSFTQSDDSLVSS